jgi:heavy metal sensor kinase
MLLRSVTSRLVFSYCVLLVMLGSGFLAFTVFSFQHYTSETIADELIDRTPEIWATAEGLLDQPARLADLIERRFAPESQGRFIRIREGAHVLYRSGQPTDRDFDAASVPLTEPAAAPREILNGNLLIDTRDFDGGTHTVTIESGQSNRFARDVQRRLAESLFVGLPVLMLLAALAGYALMRRALTPVEVMINAAEAYTFNDRHNRLPLVGTEPRIEALGLALNRMLDRLDNAYTHVSRFSADAAHELRTPLTIIRGELELIVTQAKPSPDVARAMSNALEEMTRLSGIIDSLITLSRMESLWGKRYHSIVDLMAVANETIEQMGLLADEKLIRLKRPQGLPVMVAGDRDRLKQTLVNLVDNAIKYTPTGGTVSVDVAVAADKACITVSDNGIGITPEHQAHIFDRFYRASPDRGEEGAGLGLAIVRSICHAHGGTVAVTSTPGTGSTFQVELPLLPAGFTATDPDSTHVAAAGAAAASIRTRVDF